MLSKATLTSFIALAISTATFCQSLPSAPHLSISQRSAFLLTDSNAREKLGITAIQGNQLASITSAYSQAQQKILAEKNPLPSELAANDREFAHAALGALLPDQKTKLLAMALRMAGVNALIDPGISASLGLSKSQESKIGTFLKEKSERNQRFEQLVAKGLEYVKRPKPGEDHKAYDKERSDIIRSYGAERKLMDADIEAISRKALAVLTPHQLTAWKTMCAG